MKNLIVQFMKFGFVGVICFVIDFAITMMLAALMRNVFLMPADKATLVGAFGGFVISVTVNYILSMKYVFVGRDDMDKKKEFIIFVILSIIGLGIHELIIMLCFGMYDLMPWLMQMLNDTMATAGAKIVATGVVMVYNFITRKIFIEKKN